MAKNYILLLLTFLIAALLVVGVFLVAPKLTLAPATRSNVVIYTDSGFSPNPINIKVGTTVIFKNQSSNDMRVASAIHPTHAVYPTMGGCVGSTFDSCHNISPGDSWSFKFDIVGSWKYHNHLNPSQTGMIIVGQ